MDSAPGGRGREELELDLQGKVEEGLGCTPVLRVGKGLGCTPGSG